MTLDGTPKAAKPGSWEGKEMLHGLGDGELHEHLAAECQHHDEERKPAPCIAHRDGSVRTPVDLRAFAGGKVQLQIDWPLGGSDAADVIPQDRHPALTAWRAQTLKSRLGAVRGGIEPLCD